MAIPAISGDERLEEEPWSPDPCTLSWEDDGFTELEEALLDCATDEDTGIFDGGDDNDIDDEGRDAEEGPIVGKEKLGKMLENDDVGRAIPPDDEKPVAMSWKNVMGPAVATIPLFPCNLRW